MATTVPRRYRARRRDRYLPGIVNSAGVAGPAGRARGPARWYAALRGRPLVVRWVVSRALLLTLALAGQVFGAQQSVLGDVDLYREWGHTLVGDGTVPGDEKWQYPPGAAVVLALPAVPRELAGVPYEVSFYLLMLVVDAVLTRALARRSPAAARYWLLATLALGPVMLTRFDLVPAAAALAAVLALDGSAPGGTHGSGDAEPPDGAGRPGHSRRLRPFSFFGALGPLGRFGGWVALGVAVKVWPGLLLVALGRRRLTRPGSPVLGRVARIVAGAGVTAAVLAAVLVLAGWWRGALGFLDAQNARGLQIEAVPATPFVVARMLGIGSAPEYSYGSLQFDGGLARAVATACSLAEVIVIAAAVLWWWARRSPGRAVDASPRPGGDGSMDAEGTSSVAGRGLALVLLIVITSRVLSPQYLVWLLVLAAAAVRPSTAGAERVRAEPSDHSESTGGRLGWSGWRGRKVDAAGLLAVCAVLSQVVYPWRYNDVVQGRVVGGLLLVARNAVLVTAAWYALRAAARESSGDGQSSGDGPPAQSPPTPLPPTPPPGQCRAAGRPGRAVARWRRAATASRGTAKPT